MVRRILAKEDRLGPTLFKDVLAFHLSPTFPQLTDSSTSPVADLLNGHLEDARRRAETAGDIDPAASSRFFLLGLYGLLVTSRDTPDARNEVLDKYLHGFVRGTQVR